MAGLGDGDLIIVRFSHIDHSTVSGPLLSSINSRAQVD